MIFALICLLLMVLTLSSYADRIYSERGKLLSREFEENIDSWEEKVEPRLGMSRAHAALSASVLWPLTLALIALVFGVLLFGDGPSWHRPTAGEMGQAAVGVVLVIVIFQRLLPFVFFTRTRGLWIARWTLVLRVLFYLVFPVTLLLGFLLSIVALSEQTHEEEDDDQAEAVEALIEAGQEEGILEESDRELVRMAVEFGDKVARDVMTPRPDVFAVEGTVTIERFKRMLAVHPFSRVPVYGATLDEVTGIVFAHDLLHVTDADAMSKTVNSIKRPTALVPETKKLNELLREMQIEKQHMRIVIDEYGGVSGLLTFEDLVEEIVGKIADEHEESATEDQPQSEADGSWVVPGGFELERLEDILGEAWQPEEEYKVKTVGGLVGMASGRIPLPGEVVEVEGVRFEVIASTDRRIQKLRISPVTALAEDS